MLGVPRNGFHHKSSTEFEWRKIQMKIVIDTVSHYNAKKIFVIYAEPLISTMFIMTTWFENVNFCLYPENLCFFSFVLRKTKQTKQEQNAVSFYFIRDSLLKCMHARVLYVLFCHRHSIRQQALIHTSLANERTNGGTNNEFNQML